MLWASQISPYLFDNRRLNFMNLALFMDRARRLNGEQPAISTGKKVAQSYGSLGSRVARLAAAMRKLTVNHEAARIGIFMENCPQYLEVLFACWYAGVVAVPVNAKLHPEELKYILTESNCEVALTTSKLSNSIAEYLPSNVRHWLEVDSGRYDSLLAGEMEAPANVRPEDPAWIFYTSGTTGKPKGAVLTHGNLIAMASCYFLDIDPKGPWDSIIHAAPMSHGSGLYSIPHVMKASCHVIPEGSSFDANETLELTNRWQNSVLFAAPTMVKNLVSAAKEGKENHLRLIIYGGGPMYLADCKDAIAQFGPEKLVQLYGQGESPMTITSLGPEIHGALDDPAWETRISSVGTAQSLVQVKIANESGDQLTNGDIGEVLVKGPTVMSGYLNNPVETQRAIRHGWLHTGDYGQLDDAGFLTLMDRRHDLIISGGTNIYPREVEEALSHHEDIAEVAVIGKVDPEWGQRVIAYVVFKNQKSLSFEQLENLCLSSIARFKRPKEYRVVDTLPKNNYGKIAKTAIRELEASMDAASQKLLELGDLEWSTYL